MADSKNKANYFFLETLGKGHYLFIAQVKSPQQNYAEKNESVIKFANPALLKVFI